MRGKARGENIDDAKCLFSVTYFFILKIEPETGDHSYYCMPVIVRIHNLKKEQQSSLLIIRAVKLVVIIIVKGVLHRKSSDYINKKVLSINLEMR